MIYTILSFLTLESNRTKCPQANIVRSVTRICWPFSFAKPSSQRYGAFGVIDKLSCIDKRIENVCSNRKIITSYNDLHKLATGLLGVVPREDSSLISDVGLCVWRLVILLVRLISRSNLCWSYIS